MDVAASAGPELGSGPAESAGEGQPFHIPAGTWWAALREELLMLSYDLAGSKTRLIEKQELKDRLGRSPDIRMR